MTSVAVSLPVPTFPSKTHPRAKHQKPLPTPLEYPTPSNTHSRRDEPQSPTHTSPCPSLATSPALPTVVLLLRPSVPGLPLYVILKTTRRLTRSLDETNSDTEFFRSTESAPTPLTPSPVSPSFWDRRTPTFVPPSLPCLATCRCFRLCSRTRLKILHA